MWSNLTARMSLRSHIPFLLVLFVVGSLGCAQQEPVERGAPEGWTEAEARWWLTGIDTSGVFRDLETLEAMALTGTETTYLATPQMMRQRATIQDQFERSVRRRLLPLYRNQPEVVDSLFELHVRPLLKDAVQTGDLKPQVDTYQRRAYTLLRKHFREPQMALQLGKDIPVPYPDSLRERGVGGRVRTQVYLNAEGEPQAVELLEGAHPVLDDIAQRATAQMRWSPAYSLRNGRWVPIPSWTRFSVVFEP